MIELTVQEFINVLPLLNGIKQKVLPFAICEGINPGRVFVDRVTTPRVAMIWSPVGYYFLAGKPSPSMDMKDISETLTRIFVPASKATGENSFILITSSDAWKTYLPLILPEREIIEIYRRPFELNLTRFAEQKNWKDKIPAGYSIHAMDASLAEKAGVLASWKSIDAFLEHGAGCALMNGDEIVSTCISIFSSQDAMEIDVHTAEKYQRRGFAILTASAFIEECLQHGKQPNWECFWDNEPSTNLAQKLNFTPLPDYPVHYWEE